MSKNPLSPLAAINLHQLLLIRAVIIAALALALAFAHWREATLYTQHLALILTIWALLNLASYQLRQKNDTVSHAQFFAHLCLDVVIFAAFLYFAGGASNPFVSYFLVPISIAATTLSLRHAMALTGLALLAYTQLLFFYLPLDILSPSSMHGNHSTDYTTLNLHIVGMWFNFLVSAIIITVFVVRLSKQLRDAGDQLANVREHQLQNEQLLAIASITAGAAHELGTPLNTMTLLAGDMQPDDSVDQRKEDIQLMRDQLALCKTSLQTLVETARKHSEGNRERCAIEDFIASLKSRWMIIRPDTKLTTQSISGCEILDDPTLSQTLLNLLNNAADNSATAIELRCTDAGESLLFAITDFGEPIANEHQTRLGQAFNSSKTDKGLGLGLFLSHATARRLGGTLHYLNDEQGNHMQLLIPKASLQ